MNGICDLRSVAGGLSRVEMSRHSWDMVEVTSPAKEVKPLAGVHSCVPVWNALLLPALGNPTFTLWTSSEGCRVVCVLWVMV